MLELYKKTSKINGKQVKEVIRIQDEYKVRDKHPETVNNYGLKAYEREQIQDNT